MSLRCIKLLAKEHVYKLLMPAATKAPTKRKNPGEETAAPADDGEAPKDGKPKAAAKTKTRKTKAT